MIESAIVTPNGKVNSAEANVSILQQAGPLDDEATTRSGASLPGRLRLLIHCLR